MVAFMYTASPGELSDPEFDPTVPVAYPVTAVTDLMGDMPVRVRAEGQDLVVYGFGNQRVAIARAKVGTVMVHSVRDSKGNRTKPSLLVFDHQERLLLRVRGKWGTPGLDKVCSYLRLGSPSYGDSTWRSRRAMLAKRADGYQTVRAYPRGYVPALLVGILVTLTVLAWSAAGGVQLALLLPGAIGGARNLIAMALAVACVTVGLWLITYLWRLLVGALRWAVASRRASSPAPLGRFLRVTGTSKWTTILPTVALTLSAPALLIWGVVVEGATISHGFHDQALVSDLRQHGVTVPGVVINVPYETTDSNGNVEWHDQANLQFNPTGGTPVQVPDPAIAGWTWPMNPYVPVPIVYDPANPDTAAARGQITGSPWHGAPTGNLAGGAVAILLVPPLAWLSFRRITASRRKARDEAIQNLA
jgi:hypothetical protein